MKSFSFNKLPDSKYIKNKEDLRSETQINLWIFLKDTLWDNIFVYPIANILYLILIACGVVAAVLGGDLLRLAEVSREQVFSLS